MGAKASGCSFVMYCGKCMGGYYGAKMYVDSIVAENVRGSHSTYPVFLPDRCPFRHFARSGHHFKVSSVFAQTPYRSSRPLFHDGGVYGGCVTMSACQGDADHGRTDARCVSHTVASLLSAKLQAYGDAHITKLASPLLHDGGVYGGRVAFSTCHGGPQAHLSK